MLFRCIFAIVLVKVTIGAITSATLEPNSNILANNVFKLKVTSDIDDTIKLSISSGKLNGDLEKDCKANTEIVFSDLSIQTVGDYKLEVYWSGSKIEEINFTVIAAKQAISLTMPPGFSVNISGLITVTVYDTVGNLWPTPEGVYLETDDNSFENMSATLSNSIAKFTVTFTTDGTKTLLISTDSGTNKIALASVGTRIMKYLVGPSNEIHSTDSMQILLQVYDVTGTTAIGYEDYTVTLELFCIGVCSSIYTTKSLPDSELILDTFNTTETTDGQAYFNAFRVVASGDFQFKASCPDLPTAYSNSFIAINKYKSMEFSHSPANVTTNFDFSLKIDLIGEDNEPSAISSTITIECEDNSINGETIIKTNGRSAETNLWFTKYGLKTLILSSTLSSEIYKYEIDVLPNSIYIDPIFEDEKPTNTRQTFVLNITIMDWDSKNINTAHGSNKLEFSLEPSGKLEGTQTSVETFNGVVYVDDLIPSEPGDYYLVITIDDDYRYVYEKEKFNIESTSCLPGSGPISCMSVMIFLAIVLSILFYYMDKNEKNYPHLKFPPWLIHLFSSLFFTQPNKRRLLLCLSIFTCELIMLTVIGAVYAYYDSPLEHYEREFTDYYGRQLYKGGTGWALAQGGIIPIFFLAFYSIGSKDIAKICFWTCVALNFLCFGAIVGMTIKYCIGYSVYWTANFLIFILFDLIIMQPIYTVICYFLMTKKIKSKLYGKGDNSDEDSAAPNDNLQQKEIKGFTEGNPDRNNE